jgi:hypothetical protein
MKVKPKSCSCFSCRHSPVRGTVLRYAERANRRAVKMALATHDFIRVEDLFLWKSDYPS